MTGLEILPGTLDLLVLQMLAAHGADHGYGIGNRLTTISGDQFSLNPGTVYASLVRLQANGWIRAEWGTSENNRRAKFYRLTASGRRRLDREASNWFRLVDIMQSALAGTTGE